MVKFLFGNRTFHLSGIVAFLCFLFLVKSAEAQRTASTSGSWTNTATWGGSSVPTATDAVTINAGITVTVSASASCASLYIAPGASLSIANTFSVVGTTSVSGTAVHTSTTGTKTFAGDVYVDNSGIWTNSVNEAIIIGGSLQNDGSFTAGSGLHTFTGTGKIFSGSAGLSIPSLSVTGTYTNNFTQGFTINTSIAGAGTLSQGSGSILNIGGTAGAITLNASVVTNTVNYTGASTQTVLAGTYNDLSFSGGGPKTFSNNDVTVGGLMSIASTSVSIGSNTLTLNGGLSITSGTLVGGTTSDLIVGSSLTLPTTLSSLLNLTLNSGTTTLSNSTVLSGSLIIASGSTLNIPSSTSFTVNSTTSLSGEITFNTSNSNKFTGKVTVNNTGTWNNLSNADVFFGGSLQNDGSFAAGTGVHTFTGVAQTITSSSVITIPTLLVTGTYTNNASINSNSLTVTSTTLTNNGTITTNTLLSGTGTLNQGVGSLLNIGGAATFSTITASAVTNTVNYTGLNQIIHGGTYNTLLISGTGVATSTAAITVNTNLNLTAANTFSNGASVTVSNNLYVSPTSTLSVANTFSVAGTTSVSGTAIHSSTTGTVTYGGTVFVNNGGVWNETVDRAIVFGGSLQNDGSFTAGTGVHTFTGAAQTITSSSVITIPTLSVTGTYTNNASINSNSLTVTSTTLTNNGTITTNTLLSGTGTLNQGVGSLLNIGGAATFSTITASAVTNTVNYTGLNQIIHGGTYNTLLISGTGVATSTAAITVNTNLNLTAANTFSNGASVTVSNNLYVSPTSTLSVANTFSVAGTTSVSGTAIHSSTTGTVTYVGTVFVNNGGVWNETVNRAIVFGGSLQNDGSFTAGTGVHTFTGAAQTITSSSVITIPTLSVTGTYTNNASINSNSLTVTSTTLTNNGTITTNTLLSGTGTLSQGSGAILNIGGAANTLTINAPIVTNTVNYNGATQTVLTGTYNALNISGGGTKTLANDVTVGGLISITSASVSIGANALTLNGGLSTSSGTLVGGTTSDLIVGSSLTLPSTLSSLLNLTVNSGTTSLSGALNIGTTSAGTLSLSGGIVVTSSASVVAITNTVSGSVVGGSSTSYVDGPLKRTLKSGTNAGDFLFPVGKGGQYYPFTITSPTTSASSTLTVESFNTGSGGSTATVSCSQGISSTEYWSASLSTGSITSSYISLGRQSALGTLDAVGRSSTSSPSGTYSSYQGTVSGTNINNSKNVGTISSGTANIAYFAMVERCTTPPTLTSPTSTSITVSSAVLGGSITALGCSDVTERGVYWSTTSFSVTSIAGTNTISTTNTVTPYTIGSFTVSATGLPSGCIIYYMPFATNIDGETGYASLASFSTISPTVTSVTSTNLDGTYIAGNQIFISVIFNGSVTVTGTPRLKLETGTTDQYAYYTSGSGTQTLSLTYTVQAGDETSDLQYFNTSALELNGGTILSACGNTISATLPGTATANSLGGSKAIVVDAVAPTITTYNPGDNSTNVAVNTSLIIVFSTSVKQGTGGFIDIYNSNGTIFESIPYNDSRVTISSNTVTINPNTNFSFNSIYYVQISSTVFTDLPGNAFIGINNTTDWNFTTHQYQKYYVNGTYSSADDIYTTVAGTNTATYGQSPSTPAATLGWLLNTSGYSFQNGDTIFIDAGIYSDSQLSSPPNGVVIKGAGLSKTIFDNSSVGYFMYINDDNTVLSDMSITTYNQDAGSLGQSLGITANTIGVKILNVQNYWGTASNYGAGYPIVVGSGASVLFSGGGSNCDGGGGSSSGGGINVKGATTAVTITNYMFIGNQGSFSDGIALRVDGGIVTVKNTLFQNNSAESAMQGAAISIASGTLNVYDSKITDNNVRNNSGGTEVGGSIYVTGGKLYMTRSIIQNMTESGASYHLGSGIGNSGGTVQLDSCYFANNGVTSASSRDVYNGSGTTLARYCSFNSTNSQIGSGAGTFTIENSGNPSSNGMITKTNTITTTYTPSPIVPAYSGTCSSSISTFTILPIELTQFNGDCSDGNVLLTWQTATEKNNKLFTIERSVNGVDFNVIGSVAGSGTSLQLRNYKFVDADDIKGIVYYRLSQEDYDGKQSQSNIISVDKSCQSPAEPEIVLYPNPTQQNATIDVKLLRSSQVAIEVMDAIGRTVKSIQMKRYDEGIQSIDMNLDEVSKGIYFLNVVVNEQRFTQKFVKL